MPKWFWKIGVFVAICGSLFDVVSWVHGSPPPTATWFIKLIDDFIWIDWTAMLAGWSHPRK